MDLAKAENLVSEYEKGLTGEDKENYLEAKKSRTVLRRNLTLSVNKLNELVKDAASDVHEVRVHLTKVNDLAERLEKAQLEFEQAFSSDAAAEASMYMHHHKYGQHILTVQARANKFIANAAAPKAPTQSTSIMLPKAQLPKFAGKSGSEYQTFINIFKSMVDAKPLAKAEKLTYLKLCLTGEAEILANGYTEITDDNYDSLLDQLKTKYGQPRFIQRDHYNGILDMPSFQWKELPTWMTTFMTHIRTLESLGLDVEANSGFIVCIAQKRMPQSLNQKWEEEITATNRFSARTLFTFLETKAKACVAQEKPAASDAVKPKKQPEKQGTTSVFTARVSTCTMCSGSHEIESCHRFLNLSVQERQNFCRQNRLCIRCLRQHSMRDTCTGSCTLCTIKPRNETHHTLLHFERSGQKVNNNPSYHHKKETKSVSTVRSGNTVLLKTCEAKAMTPSGQPIRVRVFFDEGAEASFCTMQAQKRGHFRSRGVKVLEISAFGNKDSAPAKPFLHVEIPLLGTDGRLIKIEAAVYDGEFCKPMKAMPFDPRRQWAHLKGVDIKDRYPRSEQTVDILIGLN